MPEQPKLRSALPSKTGGSHALLRLAPGQKPVGDYELVHFLGGGGFGEVWKATGPGGLDIALKFVRLDAQAGAIEQRALDIIKKVRHPHLLALFGAWQRDGYLILAMELADTSLSRRLNESPTGLARDELLEYMREAAKGLDHLNAQHIQHRDVKPHNLLLAGGSVKVADFGLAQLLQHPVTGNKDAMTIGYAAPECFGAKLSDHSDQYSLAATYCQLRGGRLPFEGTVNEVMIGHLMHPPDLTMLPEAKRAVVARALAKNPLERWPSCRAFVDALSRRAVSAPGETPTLDEKVLPWTRKRPRRRGPLLLAALLLIVLGGGGLAWFVRPDKAEPATLIEKVMQADPPKSEPTTKKPSEQPTREPKEEIKSLELATGLSLFAPRELTVRSESRKKLDVQVRRENAQGPVVVEVTGLPAGVTAQPVTLKDEENEAQVELIASDTVMPGEWTVTVQARLGSVRQSREVSLTVRVTPRLRLLPVAGLTVEAGKRQVVEIGVERRHFAGPVRVVLSDLPDGVQAKTVLIPADATGTEVELSVVEAASPVTRHAVRVEAFGEVPPTEGHFELTIRPPTGTEARTNSIGLRLVRIPAGTFMMGSPENELDRYVGNEGPQHQVLISHPFYLGVTEVTRGQFRQFVEATGHITDAEKKGDDEKQQGGWGFNKETGKFEGRDPQYTWRNPGFDQTDEHPVVNVSWNDAKAFCDWLETKEPGKHYRLPTEAEWEYSCRAHTTTRFHSGEAEASLVTVANVADDMAWQKFKDWSWTIKGRDGYVFTAPVGQFKLNPFGLFDMHGNVWEWCQDVYQADYYKGRPNPDLDPQGPEPRAGSFRVIRGGSFYDVIRSASRYRYGPADRFHFLGFRVLCAR